MPLLFKEQSYQIRHCVYEVVRKIGSGWDEQTYHQALLHELRLNGFEVKSKVQLPILYQKQSIIFYESDLLVNNQIILELKCVRSGFQPLHFAQLISYLKASRYRLGLLVNFGGYKAKIERILFSEKNGSVIENYEKLKKVSPDEKELFKQLRKASINIFHELRAGYTPIVYQRAMEYELSLIKAEVNQQVVLDVMYGDNYLNSVKIDFWLICNKILLAVLAGSRKLDLYDIARMQAYLDNSIANVGLICYFDKSDLTLLGLNKTSLQL